VGSCECGDEPSCFGTTFSPFRFCEFMLGLDRLALLAYGGLG
jgi:hypothetical protein